MGIRGDLQSLIDGKIAQGEDGQAILACIIDELTCADFLHAAQTEGLEIYAYIDAVQMLKDRCL